MANQKIIEAKAKVVEEIADVAKNNAYLVDLEKELEDKRLIFEDNVAKNEVYFANMFFKQKNL